MRCWGEVKSLKLKRARSDGEVKCIIVIRAIFRICGNESRPGLQLVEISLPPRLAGFAVVIHKVTSYALFRFFVDNKLEHAFYEVC